MSLSFSAQRFPSVHLTIKDGLPSNAVYCVLKDSRGIIWIGTDAGLVKYDGFQLKTFTKKNGLAGNFIRDIKEDKKGNLWIACYGDGLTKFDGKKYKNFSTKNGLVHNQIRTLFFSSKNELFIGTERGLSIFQKDKFQNLLIHPLDFYDRFQIMKIWEKNGKLFFLSRTHGYFSILKSFNNPYQIKKLGKNTTQIYNFCIGNKKYFSNDQGLFLDKSKGYVSIDSTEIKKLSDILVWDEVVYKNNNFLAGYCPFCDNGGLFSLKNDKIINVSNKFGITSKQVWNLFLDKSENKLWVGTLDQGLYILDLNPKVKFSLFRDLVYFEKNDFGTIYLQNDIIYFQNQRFKYQKNIKDFHEFAKSQLPKYVQIEKKRKDVKGNVFFYNQHIRTKTDNFNVAKIYKKRFIVSSRNGIFELSFDGRFLSFFSGSSSNFELINENTVYWHDEHRLSYILERQKKYWFHFPININGELSKINEKEIIRRKSSLIINSSEKGLLCLSFNDLRNYKVLLNEIPRTIDVWNNTLFVVDNLGQISKYKITDSLKFIGRISKLRFYGESIFKINHNKNNLLILTNKGLNIINNKTTILLNKSDGLNFEDVIRTFVYGDTYFLVCSKGVFEINLAKFNRRKSKFFFIQKFKKFGQKNAIELPEKKGQTNVIDMLPNDKGVVIDLGSEFVYHPEKIKVFFRLNQGNWTPVFDRRIIIQQLAFGNYTLELKVTNLENGVTSTKKLAEIVVKPPFYRSAWFVILSMLTFVGIVILISTWRTRTIQKRERQKSALLKRIAETKLEALQSQMNPHFIFNALTAIQSYVLKSDIDKTLLYMDKFSKLTRQTLEFSSRLQITLLEELEYLSHFCALENMRFGDQVKVQFDVGELDTSKILIPPLLIQPLVENAFEHGFINREKAYELHLHFFIENEQLIVQVSDNGEGFETTTLYKPSSKAIHIIKERLSLLDPKLVEHFSIKRASNQTIIQFALPIVTL